MKRLSLLLLTVILLFGSCKKKEDTSEVTPEMARDTLYYIMKAYYYWYNQMPVVDRNNYSDPYELLDAMMYKELDRWSFVADYQEFIDEMEGTFVGHGIMVSLSSDNKARIAQIYKNSPLYSQGVRRSWIIKTINGYDLAAIMLAHNTEAYNTAFGPSSTTVINDFVFEKPDGSTEIISSQKASFTLNSVILYDTLWLDAAGTKKAGHLVFESFIEPSQQELQTAFSFFKSAGVTDLILDLRYNTGGYLSIAQQLASYIGGNTLSGKTFATLQYNDKFQEANETFKFLTTSYSLSLPKIVVITTRSTASASEAVINGLAPHINVALVGDTTHGKPVGMNGWPCGKKYFFWPITFKLINSIGTGDYFDGFLPDQLTTDDLTHDFDDRREECLKEAILYLKTGSFSGKGSASFSRSRQYSEKPLWMNNMFIKN
jgi:carboxyl-terminal processing protease